MLILYLTFSQAILSPDPILLSHSYRDNFLNFGDKQIVITDKYFQFHGCGPGCIKCNSLNSGTEGDDLLTIPNHQNVCQGCDWRNGYGDTNESGCVKHQGANCY